MIQMKVLNFCQILQVGNSELQLELDMATNAFHQNSCKEGNEDWPFLMIGLTFLVKSLSTMKNQLTEIWSAERYWHLFRFSSELFSKSFPVCSAVNQLEKETSMRNF